MKKLLLMACLWGMTSLVGASDPMLLEVRRAKEGPSLENAERMYRGEVRGRAGDIARAARDAVSRQARMRKGKALKGNGNQDVVERDGKVLPMFRGPVLYGQDPTLRVSGVLPRLDLSNPEVGSQLPPGVYGTFPYSGIVMVPELSETDKKSIMPPPDGDPGMPIRDPGLSFEPIARSRGK